MIDIEEIYEEVGSEEYGKFSRVKSRRSRRPDLHAFLLLDELLPGDTDMISAAEHDQIFLGIEVEQLNKTLSREQAIELFRCGVFIDEESLAMFV